MPQITNLFSFVVEHSDEARDIESADISTPSKIAITINDDSYFEMLNERINDRIDDLKTILKNDKRQGNEFDEEERDEFNALRCYINHMHCPVYSAEQLNTFTDETNDANNKIYYYVLRNDDKLNDVAKILFSTDAGRGEQMDEIENDLLNEGADQIINAMVQSVNIMNEVLGDHIDEEDYINDDDEEEEDDDNKPTIDNKILAPLSNTEERTRIQIKRDFTKQLNILLKQCNDERPPPPSPAEILFNHEEYVRGLCIKLFYLELEALFFKFVNDTERMMIDEHTKLRDIVSKSEIVEFSTIEDAFAEGLEEIMNSNHKCVYRFCSLCKENGNYKPAKRSALMHCECGAKICKKCADKITTTNFEDDDVKRSLRCPYCRYYME